MGEDFNTDGMLDIFLYESEQLLENLVEVVLAHKDDTCFDDVAINEIFRVMHTIKGSSGIMMYENITKVSHKLEDVFYYLRESRSEKVPHLELVDYVLTVSDFITGELDKIKNGDTPDGDPTDMLLKLEEFLKKLKSGIVDQGQQLPPENKYVAPSQFYIAPVASENSKFYKIALYYKADTQMSNIRAYTTVYALKEAAEDVLYMPEDIITNESSGDVVLAEGFHMLLQTQWSEELIKEILEKSTGLETLEMYEISTEEFAEGFRERVSVPVTIDLGEFENQNPNQQKQDGAAIQEPLPGDYVIKSKEPGKGKKLAKNQGKNPQKQSFISVNIEKMDALMDLIGELVIAEAVVLQNPDLKVPGLDLTNFQKASGQLSKITSELQDVIMSMRMMPLTNTFQKMNRIVFDVSRKMNKDIELDIIGENTEVDKNIIEHISDPLMHLIRNAVDHGIESKEEREAAGKSSKGKITLEAKNEGGKVYIIVKDDGKGLNRDKILKKAKQNGLLGKRLASELSDKEVFQFITHPGFSTKEQVTEYSGRGVGMDVVVKNIQSIGGKLEIDSVEGQGSEMVLKIPLTLAIIDGIVMQSGQTTFVVEIGAVKEFIGVSRKLLVREPDGEEYVNIRGEYYPLVRLNQRYHLEHGQDRLEDGIVAVLEYEGRQVCVFVDKLIAEQEIVVKPIPSYVKKIDGISGCTQLGDGSIALILDISGLIQG